MSERRYCHETTHKDQDVNSREQNEGGTTKLRCFFHSEIIYMINDMNVQ